MVSDIASHKDHLWEIDLSTRQVTHRTLSNSVVKAFLGGRGVAAYLLAKELEADVARDALIVATGSLTGTNAPMSGRCTFTFVSPATGLYFKTSAGGQLGLYCRLQGIDYLIIRGRASSPVYLWIDENGPQIRSAEKLWGKTIRATNQILDEDHPNGMASAAIGPAGEKDVLFASIMCSCYNAAGRGGGGAVMGRKRLKAIAVARPTGCRTISDPERFRRVRQTTADALLCDTMARSYFDYGTAASVGAMNEMGVLPSYNFRAGSVPDIEELTSQHWNDQGLLKGRIGCAACLYSCHRFVRIDEGPYQGACSAGPEYETVSALGSGTGVTSIGAVQRANELCNDLGMDTISVGGVIQWAMETHEKKLLGDALVDGLTLEFGDEDTLIRLASMIAHREGIGDLLADGVARAAERVGHDAWKWAVHTRGLEQSRVETRGAMGYALAFAVNPRGPDHLHTECLAEFGMTVEAVRLIEQITGDEELARPDTLAKRADIVRWHEDIYAVSDALGLCAFITTAAYGATPARCAEMFSSATGIEVDGQELMMVGRRTITLERLVNLRLGWREEPTSYAPWRLMNELPDGTMNGGRMLDASTVRGMVQAYYRQHGWDEDTGVPGEASLREVDLAAFIGE